MTTLTERIRNGSGEEKAPEPPRCRDFDEDCFGLDHLHCWLYDPAKGYCPFLGPRS